MRWQWRAYLRGAGTLLDLSGSGYRRPRQRPLRGSLADDWRAVGDDLRSVLGQSRTTRNED
jgi:hypothetical protein